MSAPYHTILTKAEDNLYSYVDANRSTYLTSKDIYRTFAGVETTGTFIKLLATTAEPQEEDGIIIDGNYYVTVEVYVVSNMADTDRTTHVNIVGELSDLMWQDDLATQLNAQSTPDYNVYWIRQGAIEQGAEGTTAFTKLTYRIYCRPS